ncbi:conserved Plasmodium protein, unknown function [Plasmodium gallinaceum]|uniref:Uncharacterized protein n=1 Tax=Plasmodium gallinaceum TaxID=5849 RepID=A0A1J1GWX2_PLAGA|nr:conserved Plasmodium protein, unknown function [Plasmodium gallinaceum]CRG96759.1 conserved Plasmodium protein, unknown function [Plasmodium gallinaceum]
MNILNNSFKVDNSTDNLLKKIKHNVKTLNKKDIVNNIEYYICILSNINLKYVYNKNYKLTYLILKLLIENGLNIETIIIDKILPLLNLKYILEKNKEIKIITINKILCLINKNEKINLNTINIFNMLFDTIILLIDIFYNCRIYCFENQVDYTLSISENKENEKKNEETELLFDSEKNKKHKKDKELLIDGKKNNDICRPPSDLKFNKKRKKENNNVELNDSNYTINSITKIYDLVNNINNIFSLYFKNFKIINNDIKIYAFFNNLFALYCYSYDYIQKLNHVSTNDDDSTNLFNIINDLYILKNNIKRFIILCVENVCLQYFKNIYNLYDKSKYTLKMNYLFFNFSDNNKILEIIYIIFNKIGNNNPCFNYDFQNNKLNCLFSINKNKMEKLEYYFKNDNDLNNKYKFLNIVKIKGSIKILLIIMKYLIMKYNTSNFKCIQSFILFFLLIPHFELCIYNNSMKNEYLKLFDFSHLKNKEYEQCIQKKNVNEEETKIKSYKEEEKKKKKDKNDNNLDENKVELDGYLDEEENIDSEVDLDEDIEKHSETNCNKINEIYYKKMNIKIPYSSCIFQDVIDLNSDKEVFSNLHILVEYSKLIYKCLNYLNSKNNIKKDSFLFINLAYFVKYIFDCITNAYFLLSDKNKSAIKECKENSIFEKYSHFKNNYEKIYIKGKPHLVLYNSKLKNIFNTCVNKNNDNLIHLFCISNKKTNIFIYLNYLIYTNQLNLINILNFDIKPCKFIFSTLFSFIRRINFDFKYSNLNIFTNYYIHNFSDHIIKNILTIFINIFDLNYFIKYIHNYIGIEKLPHLRMINFLLNSIFINVFKDNMNKLIDQHTNFCSYFIELYEFHINEFNTLLDKILSSIKNNFLLNSNKCFKIQNNENINLLQINDENCSISQLVQKYQVMFVNIETLEYIFCCYLKSIYKNNISSNFLKYIQKIVKLYLKKKKNIIIFHEQIKGNFFNTKYYNFYFSIYIFYFFNFCISRIATYAILNSKTKTEILKKKVHLIISLLQNNFINIELTYDQCIEQDSIYKFFDLLQIILKTLFFYIYFAEFHLLDKRELIEYFKQISNVLKKNSLEDYSYVMKKRINKHILSFFIYNYNFIMKIFDDNEEIENIYLELIKIIFIDINIIKNEHNYNFFFEFFFNIQEKTRLTDLFNELFTLHFILIINNLENDLREKKELIDNENICTNILQNEEINLINYSNVLIEKNIGFTYNNDWYEIFNLSKKLIFKNNLYDNYENIMIDIFSKSPYYNIPSYMYNKYSGNINLDICILSKLFVLFNDIENMQEKLYTLLCKIFENFHIYNIYYEYILINILLCFIKNLQSLKKRKANISIFIKFSFYIFKKQKEYIDNGKYINNKNIFVLKLFFHIFFIFINIYKNEESNYNILNNTKDDTGLRNNKINKKILDKGNEQSENDDKDIRKNINTKIKNEKLEACFLFFIKYFIVTHNILIGEKKNNDIDDENISYMLNHLNICNNDDNSNRNNNNTLNVGKIYSKKLIKEMKKFIKNLLINNQNDITIKINSFFLGLIEYIFFSFFTGRNFKKNCNNKIILKIINMFKKVKVDKIFFQVSEEYKTFLYSIFILKIFNIKKKKKLLQNVEYSKDKKITKNFSFEDDDENSKNVEKEKSKTKINIINKKKLILFFKLFLSIDLSNIYIFKEEQNKKSCIIIYDFIFHYNKILVESNKKKSIYICLKYKDILKKIVNLLSYTSAEVEFVLKYVDIEINKIYEEKEIKDFLFYSNIHIMTLIYIFSNNKEFLSHIILLKQKSDNCLLFINLYFHIIKYTQSFLENLNIFKNPEISFLLYHFIYKLSQLFNFFFVKLKFSSTDNRYSTFLLFVSDYCNLLVKIMDILKKKILKSNDRNETILNKSFITHFYILNNSNLFEKKKFYLYLLSHQLFTILYEFFNIKRNEKIIKSKKTFVEVIKKSAYIIKYLCSYLDSILYFDNRINKILLRNANFFMNFLKNNKNTLNLSKIAFPVLIQIVDIYEIISKNNEISEEKYEEKQILKNVFLTSLSILEDNSIQFCYSLLNEKKKEIFNVLSS